MLKSITSRKYLKLLKRLRLERESENISMRALATKLDVAHSFVAKVESGERWLDVYEYVQYCKALDIEPTEGLKLLK